MMRQIQIFKKLFLSILLLVTFSLLVIIYPLGNSLAAPIIPHPDQLAKAVQEIEALDAMRTGLAATLKGKTEEPTQQTMKEVCRPVGMQAMKLAQDNGWQVQQIAKKYRNPAHALKNFHDKIAIAKFEKNPELVGFWEQEILDEQSGTHYYRRINVESTCLVCHGLKDSRPQFVKEGYPQDLAYNFNVGDLRGMYSVFIPDNIQKAIQDATN